MLSQRSPHCHLCYRVSSWLNALPVSSLFANVWWHHLYCQRPQAWSSLVSATWMWTLWWCLATHSLSCKRRHGRYSWLAVIDDIHWWLVSANPPPPPPWIFWSGLLRWDGKRLDGMTIVHCWEGSSWSGMQLVPILLHPQTSAWLLVNPVQ